MNGGAVKFNTHTYHRLPSSIYTTHHAHHTTHPTKHRIIEHVCFYISRYRWRFCYCNE